jgi:hypothetical protein
MKSMAEVERERRKSKATAIISLGFESSTVVTIFSGRSKSTRMLNFSYQSQDEERRIKSKNGNCEAESVS